MHRECRVEREFKVVAIRVASEGSLVAKRDRERIAKLRTIIRYLLERGTLKQRRLYRVCEEAFRPKRQGRLTVTQINYT